MVPAVFRVFWGDSVSKNSCWWYVSGWKTVRGGVVVSRQLWKRTGVLTGVPQWAVLGLLCTFCVCVNDLNEGIESIFNKFTHNSKLRGNRIPNELDELQKALPTPPPKACNFTGTADSALQQVEMQEQHLHTHGIQNSPSEENAGSYCALFTWSSMPAMSSFCEKY